MTHLYEVEKQAKYLGVRSLVCLNYWSKIKVPVGLHFFLEALEECGRQNNEPSNVYILISGTVSILHYGEKGN